MDKVYIIISAIYSGGEWNESQVNNLVFSTFNKAQKHIDDNLQNKYTRYEVKEVDLV